jgi:predicted phage terminase large subunit-like protein
MTLTAAEIESVRRFLGFPGGPEYRQTLSDRAAEILDDASEATVRSHLRQLDRLQQLMSNTIPFAAQTFSSGAAGTQQYAARQRMGTLHMEANHYINEISSTLCLGIHRRIYGQGTGFRTEWFTITQQLPQVVKWVRAWDFASTSDRKGDPDATASVRMGLLQNGGVIVADVTHEYLTPGGVNTRFQATAAADTPAVPQRWQLDPGQAGEYQNQALRSLLSGFDAKGITTTLSKLERANPLSRAAEFGEVYLLQAPWNNQLINELVGFPDGAHDDITDAAALAYLDLMGVGVPKFGSATYR